MEHSKITTATNFVESRAQVQHNKNQNITTRPATCACEQQLTEQKAHASKTNTHSGPAGPCHICQRYMHKRKYSEKEVTQVTWKRVAFPRVS